MENGQVSEAGKDSVDGFIFVDSCAIIEISCDVQCLSIHVTSVQPIRAGTSKSNRVKIGHPGVFLRVQYQANFHQAEKSYPAAVR